VWGLATLESPGVPSFKKIGVMESLYAAWFVVMLAIALPSVEL
jgi:hypothetical protein